MKDFTTSDKNLAEPLIRPARLSDANDFGFYVAEHVAESGQGGSPVFALSRTASIDEVRTRSVERWCRGLDEPLWARAWLLCTSSPRRIVGHVELLGGRFPSELHRAMLGMGILRSFTAQGHGRRLVEAAVTWARWEAKLSWIDLGVFSNNLPAHKFYTRMGFVELGRRKDAFRVDDGLSVDDIHMTLAL